MFFAVIAVVVGLALLTYAADQFVLGAARVALIRNVPSLVVGVVIVGFGTSAPELLVSTLAAIRGSSEIAIGNIVGSNIANLSLLLGIGAMIVPVVVDSRTVKREAPLVLGAMALFALVVQGGGISRVEGGLLLAAMATGLYVVTRRSVGDPIGPDVVELAEPAAHSIGTEALRTVLGLAGTLAGAQLLLNGALEIASRSNLSEGFVGVTMVAVGTSLPELVTVIQSARRNETDLIVGNLLGSNMFNALTVGGVAGLIGAPPIDVPSLTVVAALAAVVAAAVALLVMVTGHAVTRREGIVLSVAYLALVPFLM